MTRQLIDVMKIVNGHPNILATLPDLDKLSAALGKLRKYAEAHPLDEKTLDRMMAGELTVVGNLPEHYVLYEPKECKVVYSIHHHDNGTKARHLSISYEAGTAPPPAYFVNYVLKLLKFKLPDVRFTFVAIEEINNKRHAFVFAERIFDMPPTG